VLHFTDVFCSCRCFSIRTRLTQLCVEDISENEKQEIDEALQREVTSNLVTSSQYGRLM
jgi:hypothetical protein